jgi:hypothetical protein
MSDDASNPLPPPILTGTGGKGAPGRIRGARAAARAGQLAWVAEKLSYGFSDAQVIKDAQSALGVPAAYAYKLVREVYQTWETQAKGLINQRRYKLEEILYGVITDERNKQNGGDGRVTINAVNSLIKLYGLDTPKQVNKPTVVNNNSVGQDNPTKVRSRIRELLGDSNIQAKLAQLNVDADELTSDLGQAPGTPEDS